MVPAVITSNVCQTPGTGPCVMLQQPWGRGYGYYLTAVLNLLIAFFPSLNKEALEFSKVFVQDRLPKTAPALRGVVSILCLCFLPVILWGGSAHPVSSCYIVKMHTQIHKMGSIPTFSLDAVGLTQSGSASLDERLKTVFGFNCPALYSLCWILQFKELEDVMFSKFILIEDSGEKCVVLVKY